MKKRFWAGFLAAIMLITSACMTVGNTVFAEEQEKGRWAYDGSLIGARSYGTGSYVENGEIHSIFPEIYWPYLDALKEAYPNWKFEALQTGVEWSVAVEQEMAPRNNLVESGYYPSSWLDINSFNYKTNSWVIESHPDWVQANQQVVEAYMDPRNFLNDQYIFQFEKLTFDEETQTLAGVEAILKGTFMDGTYLENGKTYAQNFMEIGQKNNISPYHLASRVRQEQGAGTSPLISGTVPGYEGYYNYFNIEASGVTQEEIIQNGMNEAKNSGWTTRYLALEGGAKKVASYYISKCQDTLYLQKFDVDDTYNGMFWHQYMQNLSAAESECQGIRKAYANIGIIDSSFTFKIPIYKNMPSSPSQKPQGTGNPNDRLKSIDVNGIELIDFSSDDLTSTEYTVKLPFDTQTAVVGAQPVASTSSVTDTQWLDVSAGQREAVITCTAENGSKRTYKVHIQLVETPQISSVQFSDVTAKGYKVTVKLSNASKATQVLFPTWTEKNGQDDITWDSVTPSDTMTYYVDTSRHNNETGKYFTHIYVYDQNEQTSFYGGDVTVPQDSLEITGIEITDVNSSGYNVTVTLNHSDLAERVLFPTWTEKNGQDDITWDSVTPSDKMTYHVDISRHNYETGLYHTHVYAYDKQENAVVVAGDAIIPDKNDSNSSQNASLSYSAHVQNFGWMDWVSAGQTAGTVGYSLRMEGLKLNVDSALSGNIEYRAHVENIGWMDWVKDGQMAGTEGKSLRVEAFQIKLTGELAQQYKLRYRAHVQNIGWMDWVQDGETAGTTGLSLRAEALEIRLVKK